MTTALGIVLFFLGAALLLYVLFGGADFGAGILEAFLRGPRADDQRRLISHAMAPVWEANHVWLILALVIVFMGFPPVYVAMSTYLHLPILAVLAGIVARGCAFTFRYYDPPDDSRYRVYTRWFAISSIWTAFFLGVTAGAMMLGRINPTAKTFSELYIQPWANDFCFVLGMFAVFLFALLAAVFLMGESDEEELRAVFRRKALILCGLNVITGALVFLSGEAEGLHLFSTYFSRPLSISCFAIATLLIYPFVQTLRSDPGALFVRIFGAALVSLVILGWFAVQFPVALRFAPGIFPREMTFLHAAAPEQTIRALVWALLVGSAIIFPALGYLFRVFKWETIEKK